MSGNNSCSNVRYEYIPSAATSTIINSDTDRFSRASLVINVNCVLFRQIY